MTVINREANRAPATITAEQLGQAMAALDLSAIPAHKRKQAVYHHFMRIMAETVAHPGIRQTLQLAREAHARQAIEVAIATAHAIGH